MAGTELMPQKHAFHIALEDGRIGVKIARQRVSRPVITDARG